MKEIYLNKINDFIEKNKKVISGLSLTFSIYNYSRKNEDKDYNKALANNTKKLFLSISLYIIMLISIFNFTKMIFYKEKNLVLTIIYMIICIIGPLFAYNKIILKNYGINIECNGESKFEKLRCFLSKKMYNKKITMILNIFIFIYIYIMIKTDIFKNVDLSIKYFLLIVTIYIFGISRPIQFFLVFIRDIIKKTYRKDERDENGKIRLIILAIISFINLIFDYSILFYTLNTIGSEILNITMFKCNTNNIVDMIYYTAGFGEINPENFITKILVIMKNVATFMLITGNLAIYVSIDSKDKNNMELNS